MRGNTITQEYQKMIWVRDDQGTEFVCYEKELKNVSEINNDEKEHCLDTSAVLGADW